MTPDIALRITEQFFRAMGESPEAAAWLARLMDPRSDPSLQHLFAAPVPPRDRSE